jgi:23S rRNA (guanosine2251-2'-O)-methyltransferase
MEMLKKEGVWLYAADMVGDDYREVNFAGPMALIIGAEGEGVSRLVLEASDFRVSLPMRGGVGSLNASVAAGILMYAAMSGRE